MAFDILSILNGATLAETERTEEYQDIVLDYRDIVVTNHNKYSMVEIQELATGILMTGGLQAPLVVGRVSGEYWLLSGHRRYSALRQLIQEGNREYEKIPCRYKDMDKLQFRMELLCGNTFNRKLSDYDLMMQAQEWKEILTEMKTSGALVLNKGERIRDYVAQILRESSGKIGQLNAIYKSAPEKVKEKFQSGEMGITSAYEASRTVEPQEEPQPDEKSLEIQKKAEEKRVSESDTKGQRDEPYYEPDMETVETPEKFAEYDREILLKMIRNAEGAMEQMGGYWIYNNPEVYTKNIMKIQAYKLLLEQHDRGIISCPHRS